MSVRKTIICDECHSPIDIGAARHQVETYLNYNKPDGSAALDFCSFSCIGRFFVVNGSSVLKKIKDSKAFDGGYAG